MKKIFLFTFIFILAFVFSGCSMSGGPAVKKSITGICHEKGTNFYNNTKNFTSYNSIQECLDSGARLPKK